MTPATDNAAEAAVLDLFCDTDGEIDVAAALNTLVFVVAGLCCSGRSPAPVLAGEFADALVRHVAGAPAAERTLQ